ncbi:MAG: hydroxymethylglutaryl-CoA lyase [Desulfobacterales bacterium]|nr:hydroxymethylglutaryl-CoA lyase [Desulfobacterales bacterium]MBF0397265.1 hydroxymethylglutaryl-CoA lyase [Desulfobacterales bacterium]
MEYPDKVTLIEVGPRDGFQFEKKIIPTPIKIEVINLLISAGLKHIQIGSFVNPKIVPQMADTHELFKLIPQREGIILTALSLNTNGVKQANDANVKNIEISISASNTHSVKNTGMSLNEAIDEGIKMIELSKKYGMNVRGSIQCSFGCFYEGDIPEDRILKISNFFLEKGIDMLALADTTGLATPLKIKSLLPKIISLYDKKKIALHLHDTRKLGLVNLMEALSLGINHFDTSFAGLGGCPFVPNASGNISTEDTANLLESLNIKTGINVEKVRLCSKFYLHSAFNFSTKLI